MAKKTALITGASRGIGRELAIAFAENQCDVVLVARSSVELDQLKNYLEAEYDISAYTMVKDLSLPQSSQEIFAELKKYQIDVNFLVNNAGFGDYGAFSETKWERYEKMISLNIITLTHLCHLFAQDRIEQRKKGRILNLSSMAAFQPGPMMAVYFATKSFVLSLSEAIGSEFKKQGVTVTALCPGPTNTSFGEESKMSASELVNGVKIASARDVALVGYKAMMKGKPVVIEGRKNKLIPILVRLLPRRLVTWISAKVMSRKN